MFFYLDPRVKPEDDREERRSMTEESGRSMTKRRGRSMTEEKKFEDGREERSRG